MLSITLFLFLTWAFDDSYKGGRASLHNDSVEKLLKVGYYNNALASKS